MNLDSKFQEMQNLKRLITGNELGTSKYQDLIDQADLAVAKCVNEQLAQLSEVYLKLKQDVSADLK